MSPAARRLALALFALAPLAARGQAMLPARGTGALTLGYQGYTVNDHLDYRGHHIKAGTIHARTTTLQLDYGITDRLALTASLPYVQKNYSGNRPHDPVGLEEEHEHHTIDNGHYHGGWQDYYLQLRWRWLAEPIAVVPHVGYGRPSHDYTFFAHSAIGTRQERLTFGVDVGDRLPPPLQNFYYQLGYEYALIEKVRGVNVDHSTLNLELGYDLSSRWTARLIAVAQKTHGGLDFPIDFPSRSDERWYHHDQTQRIDYFNLGGGIDWRVAERWTVFANGYRTQWGENGHSIHHAYTVGLSRAF